MSVPIRWFIVVSLSSVALSSSVCGATTGEKTQALQRISFRTPRAAVLHLKSEQDVQETTEVLKEIGCDLKTVQHEGHVDLQYECRFWKTITLTSAAEVKQWYGWLTAKGFTVVHNTPGKDHAETIQYRLDQWKSFHFHNTQDREAHLATLKMLGCETRLVKHGDHEDIQARCAGWRSLGVANHSQADAWMTVLRKLGFAVDHHH